MDKQILRSLYRARISIHVSSASVTTHNKKLSHNQPYKPHRLSYTPDKRTASADAATDDKWEMWFMYPYEQYAYVRITVAAAAAVPAGATLRLAVTA